MKNTKAKAILKILAVIIVTAVIATFALLPSEIIYKKAPVVDKQDETAAQDETTEEEEDVVEEQDEDEVENDTPEEEATTPEQDKSFKNRISYQNVKLGLDLAGGVSVVYEAPKEASDEEMKAAVELLVTRLTFAGHTEAEVARQGSNRIRVELPGVSDPQAAVREIGRTAELKFYGLFQEGYQILPIQGEEDSSAQYVILKESTESEQGYEVYTGANIAEIAELVISGKDITTASKQYGSFSQTSGTEPYVKLELSSEGTTKFAEATKKYKSNFIAIVLDEDIISIPRVNDEITSGVANITGMRNDKETDALANLIKSGALPFKLEPIETSIIGARLGQDALTRSVQAGIIGIVLVLIYMLIVFRLPGFVADLALTTYLSLVMVALSGFSVTLTLPGIAGIVLSVGMAVDANVIIFARIKEEVRLGKTLASSVEAGFKKALSAIIDGNVTTLIMAGILYWQGTGPIRGFAQTLTIGIVISMFTALVITKMYLVSLMHLGIKNPWLYGVPATTQSTISRDELNKKAQKNKKRG